MTEAVGDIVGDRDERVRVRGRAVASAPSLSGAFVALPMVLAIGAASRLLTAEPQLAALLALGLAASLAILFPRATPRGRVALALPLLLVGVGAAVGLALVSPLAVVCAWGTALVALVALAGARAPRGAAGERRAPLFARLRAATVTTLALDEGGVRIERGEARGYVPFGELGPLRLTESLERKAEWVLTVGALAGDAEVELAIDAAEAPAAARLVARAEVCQREAAEPAEGEPEGGLSGEES